jgi:hypothetical protein
MRGTSPWARGLRVRWNTWSRSTSTWAEMQAAGTISDAFHPNAAFYSDKAVALTAALGR